MGAWVGTLARTASTARLGLILLGCLLVAIPAQAAAYVRLPDLVSRFALRLEVEMLSGRHTLRTKDHAFILMPGGRHMVVDGSIHQLDDAPRMAESGLLIPVQAATLISTVLGAPPVQRAPLPAPAMRPQPPTPQSPQVASAHAPLIVLDPGHGGPFHGTKAASGLCEKEVNLAIAKYTAAILQSYGYRVRLTRTSDRALSAQLNSDLDARPALANGNNADLFVSIHANHARSSSVQGFEVFYGRGSAKSLAFAKVIHSAIHGKISDVDRGVKQAGFRVLKRAHMPAVLVEVGFLSHTETARQLGGQWYREQIAQALAAGVRRYVEGERP